MLYGIILKEVRNMATKKPKLPTIIIPKKTLTAIIMKELIKKGKNVMDGLAKEVKVRRGGGI